MNTRLGHYDLVEELGRGGMGVVYKGYEASLGRFVAIKVLSAAMAHETVFVERFLREARAMATLNDSHIIQIYFIGHDAEQTFFVMEYVDGESLSSCLQRELRLVPSDALKILLQASQGLAAAHAHGVIHRDVKPGNIMLSTRGQVKLTDFGIALANHDASSKLTTTGGFVGTPGYLSPEVCLAKEVDRRSDIFALGIVLFEMLSGRTPFRDVSPLKQMLDVVQTEAPDIRELSPAVDGEIARILGRMLAKAPADRYQSCEELNADLKRHPLVVEDEPLQMVPVRAAASAAATATMVGLPNVLTPGVGLPGSPLAASSRTPLQLSAIQSATAEASAATHVTRPRRRLNRSLLLVSAAVAMALLGWLLGRAGNPDSPTAVAAAPVAPKPAVATPSANAPTVSNASPPAEFPVQAVSPMTTIAGFGHGGEHSTRNRVRTVAWMPTPAAKAPSASAEFSAAAQPTRLERIRQQARAHNRAAAQAASDRQSRRGGPSAAARPQRSFACRVFKRCAAPAKKPEAVR